MKTAIIQVVTATLGSLLFAVLFNIRGKRLSAAALGGFLSWSLYLLLHHFIASEPLCYSLVALLISLYAEAMARLLKSPTTTFITTSLLPLIPGGSLYYTMAYAFGSNLERFLEKAADTLKLASALALGIIAATTVTRLVQQYRQQRAKVKTGAV